VQVINYEEIYQQLGSLSFDYKQELINADLSSITSDKLRMEIRDDLDALLNDELKEKDSRKLCIFTL
jgi:predicted component of type VI protein secretion system